MGRLFLGVFLGVLSFTLLAGGSNVTVKSIYSVQQTADRFVEALNKEEVPVITRVKKNIMASKNGEVITFSHPLYGTIVGKCHRGTRKDKPLNAKIWEDKNGEVWLSYFKPTAFINDFGVIECGYETDRAQQLLGGFASSATLP